MKYILLIAFGIIHFQISTAQSYSETSPYSIVVISGIGKSKLKSDTLSDLYLDNYTTDVLLSYKLKHSLGITIGIGFEQLVYKSYQLPKQTDLVQVPLLISYTINLNKKINIQTYFGAYAKGLAKNPLSEITSLGLKSYLGITFQLSNTIALGISYLEQSDLTLSYLLKSKDYKMTTRGIGLSISFCLFKD